MHTSTKVALVALFAVALACGGGGGGGVSISNVAVVRAVNASSVPLNVSVAGHTVANALQYGQNSCYVEIHGTEGTRLPLTASDSSTNQVLVTTANGPIVNQVGDTEFFFGPENDMHTLLTQSKKTTAFQDLMQVVDLTLGSQTFDVYVVNELTKVATKVDTLGPTYRSTFFQERESSISYHVELRDHATSTVAAKSSSFVPNSTHTIVFVDQTSGTGIRSFVTTESEGNCVQP